MGKIIVNGAECHLVAEVQNWIGTMNEVKIGKGARPRAATIDLVVWHYTGGEGDANQLFKVLKSRELGVEFFIDRAGLIYQFCDPALVDTFDAGYVNARSVGVEIANYGYRKDRSKVPKAGLERPLYNARINGHDYKMARFWPQQMAAALALADALSTALHIVRRVPVDPANAVLARTMSRDEIEAFAGFTGHVGHYHVSEAKIDPGLDLLEMFHSVFG